MDAPDRLVVCEYVCNLYSPAVPQGGGTQSGLIRELGEYMQDAGEGGRKQEMCVPPEGGIVGKGRAQRKRRNHHHEKGRGGQLGEGKGHGIPPPCPLKGAARE